MVQPSEVHGSSIIDSETSFKMMMMMMTMMTIDDDDDDDDDDNDDDLFAPKVLYYSWQSKESPLHPVFARKQNLSWCATSIFSTQFQFFVYVTVCHFCRCLFFALSN